MYIERTLEEQIYKESKFYPVLVLTGPRQVGKTTLLRHCADADRNYVSLDTLENRELAKRDPSLFLGRFPPPVTIDEIQYAPELLPYIKAAVDGENGRPGMFWLTGSQQFHMMRDVSESLAGRARILNMRGLSQGEKLGLPRTPPFFPSLEYARKRADALAASPFFPGALSLKSVFERIWTGSFPALFGAPKERWEGFYDSYVQTYIERDIRSLALVSGELSFLRFMRVLAARNAQLLNCAEISNEVGVSQPTVKSWISVLRTGGVIYLLEPYFPNVSKRAVKSPKVYFADTGLACYLAGWFDAETLERGAAAGAAFEAYAVSEILKSYWNNGLNPRLFFYRDSYKREIDLLLEERGTLHPVEIKKTSRPSAGDVSAFALLGKAAAESTGSAAVVCMAPTHTPVEKDVCAVPVGYV